jgi:pyruvate/2-oxoglutarate dehydrogenase complex dihydrolipoamide dehydrogenase (E3) component
LESSDAAPAGRFAPAYSSSRPEANPPCRPGAGNRPAAGFIQTLNDGWIEAVILSIEESVAATLSGGGSMHQATARREEGDLSSEHFGEVLPADEHNRTLVDNVHPRSWVNPDPAARYNLVVIGAGTAGLVTAAGAAGLGAKVALIERHLLGGDCLNVGCVPSKCIIRSSRVFADLNEADRLGYHVPEGSRADFPAVMERMRRLRARISHHDSVERFSKELGIDVFLGQGCFTGNDTVEVGGKRLRFKHAVLATGARAVHPSIEGLAEAGFLTNETVFSLTERPRRLAVIGGGPIGCELAQAFRRLGCEVVLFHNAAHILNREDADAAEIVQQAFLREGVRLVLDANLKRVVKKADGKTLLCESHGESGETTVDEILVGAGRAPNVEGLNLEAVGVRYDEKHGVEVNDQLQTSNPRIYAAGDICMSQKFTHAADAAARIVIQNTLFLGHKKLSALTMPWCTYTDPEIAHVGLYERDAQRSGIAVDTFTSRLSDVDRAIADGEEDGFVKVHVKKGTGQILGATVVARHAGEMINEITLAMVGKLGLGTIAQVIHSYPTQAEAIRKAADAYNRTRLTPFVKKLFSTWLRWTR